PIEIQLVPLVVPRAEPGIVGRIREVEAEQIAADLRGLPERPCESSAPAGGARPLVGTLDLHVQGVIPRPDVVVRDEDQAIGSNGRCEAVGWLLVRGGAREVTTAVGEPVIAADSGVGR